MAPILRVTAQQIVDVVPLMMGVIRSRLHEHRIAGINVPEFRALLYINRHDGTSLSSLSAHIGLTLPSMSKLVDGLVDRELVSRNSHAGDRRMICLSLTPRGREELHAAYQFTQRFLMDRMSRLPEEDLRTVSEAMQILQGLFALDQAEQRITQTER